MKHEFVVHFLSSNFEQSSPCNYKMLKPTKVKLTNK